MQGHGKSIRERAHHMWNKAGRPEGDAEAFWLSAQSDVLAASLGQIAAVKAKLAKKKLRYPASVRRLEPGLVGAERHPVRKLP